MHIDQTLITALSTLIREAGSAIMAVYRDRADLQIDTKSDDSPVTQADLAAHKVLHAGLQALTPLTPILSEEGGIPEFAERQTWSRYWLVDPLDGTKEFINGNGEFTVNIALIEAGAPVLGLVYVPVSGILYVGAQTLGAWRETDATPDAPITRIAVQAMQPKQTLRVVGSRRHGAEALEALIARIADRFEGIEYLSMGSSLKICAIAEGKADWYPRLALTSEWDTAAAQAVLEAAGGKLFDADMKVLRYNQKDSLLNPYFHAVGDVDFNWSSLLEA